MDHETESDWPLPDPRTYKLVSGHLLMLASGATEPDTRAQFAMLAGMYEKLFRHASTSWRGPLWPFSREAVQAQAPNAPGVYLLGHAGRWVYVGATENLRKQLLSLLDGEHECVGRESPTHFGYELIAEQQIRVGRQGTLVRELSPVCEDGA